MAVSVDALVAIRIMLSLNSNGIFIEMFSFFRHLSDRPAHLSVMLSIGNALANSIWEGVISDREKPTSNSKREHKEQWIKSKYESKEFIAPILATSTVTQQLAEAILRLVVEKAT